MKKDTIKLILIALVVVILMGMSYAQLVVIHHLSNQVTELRQLINDLPKNTTTTTTVIEQKESMIISTDYSYGHVDTEKHTIDYDLKLLPRTITNDLKISLSINDIIYELEKNENYFKVMISLPLFETDADYDSTFLIIEMDGEKHIERFSDVQVNSLYQIVLKSMSASGRVTHRFSNQKLIVDYTVDVQIPDYTYSLVEDVADFTRIDMVTELNGKVIERENKTDEILSNQGYVIGGNFSDKKTIDDFYQEKDRLHIYFEAVDEYGYIHRETFAFIAPDGQYGYEDQYHNIYDQNGKVLIEEVN